MKTINIYKYPIGKLRMQPVGIIIFAAVMATLGMLLLCELTLIVEEEITTLANWLCANLFLSESHAHGLRWIYLL